MNYKQKRKLKVKSKKISNSFKYAFQGFFTALKEERNMKVHIVIMLLVIIAGFIYKINPMEWIICILLFGIVLFAELVNTSIETVVDMITPYKDKKAKIAKDVAAASVLVVAISAAIVGLIIFIPKIFLK